MHESGQSTRRAVLDAAARLLRDDGMDAVTTRRVAEAAGVQPPAIYRLFDDKDGLLRALADDVLETYVREKALRAAEESSTGGDALDDLRRSYRLHVEFGLENPELFRLMTDPARARTDADRAGYDILRARVHRLAVTGLLRVSEERAVEMISAAGNGAILCALSSPDQSSGLPLADAMFSAVMSAIATESGGSDPGRGEVLQAAVTLSAIASELPRLTDAERGLMSEWLGRSIRHLEV